MENSKNTYKILDKCLCCDSSNLQTVIDLGYQPPANSYLKSINEEELFFPLKLNYCSNCTHLQLSHAINPDILFKNYLYVSGTTKTLKDYFNNFVKLVLSYTSKKTQLKILDIACNDGSQLDTFKANGHLTYGIDPATNLFPISSKNHNIICDYFTKDSVSKFDTKFDIIIAQNVFAHNSYPQEFLRICKDYLEDDGIIFIQTSQADMVENCQFDTIYHEHISFFNPNSMSILVEKNKLFINDILKVPIHGNSYVFIISKKNKRYSIYGESKINNKTLDIFTNSVKDTIHNIKLDIKKFIDSTPKGLVVGYGAAAKGNTVLNYGKIKLDYIVDDNSLKQGLYTPGMKIPIVSLDFINSLNRNIAWIPLSWNFFEEIKHRIEQSRKNKNDIFLKLKFVP